MKKSNHVFTIIIISTLLLLVSSVAYASQYLKMDFSNIDDYVRNQEAKKAAALGATEMPENQDFYTECLKKAITQEQKDAIEKLKKDTSVGYGEYKRDALMIIGVLPKGQRRLTLEEARQVVNETHGTDDVNVILGRFNAIAGAPDFVGGSGMTRTIYFLDDNRTELIYVFSAKLIGYSTIDTNGKRISNPLFGTFAPSTSAPIPKASSN